MVEFHDGSTLAQASPPSMLIPIALGLGWPDRVPDAAPPVDWTQADRPGSSSRSTTTRSPRCGSPARPGARRHGAGGLQRRQRGLRRRRSSTGRLRFTEIVPTVGRVLAAARTYPRTQTDAHRRATSWRPTPGHARRRRTTWNTGEARADDRVDVHPRRAAVRRRPGRSRSACTSSATSCPASSSASRSPSTSSASAATLWSRRRGETEYGVKAMPLGGYVKLIGMLPPGRTARARGRAQAGSTGLFAQLVDDARERSPSRSRPGTRTGCSTSCPGGRRSS